MSLSSKSSQEGREQWMEIDIHHNDCKNINNIDLSFSLWLRKRQQIFFLAYLI